MLVRGRVICHSALDVQKLFFLSHLQLFRPKTAFHYNLNPCVCILHERGYIRFILGVLVCHGKVSFSMKSARDASIMETAGEKIRLNYIQMCDCTKYKTTMLDSNCADTTETQRSCRHDPQAEDLIFQ